eukprot:491790-Prorocentrum_minimum.AAC.1
MQRSGGSSGGGVGGPLAVVEAEYLTFPSRGPSEGRGGAGGMYARVLPPPDLDDLGETPPTAEFPTPPLRRGAVLVHQARYTRLSTPGS